MPKKSFSEKEYEYNKTRGNLKITLGIDSQANTFFHVVRNIVLSNVEEAVTFNLIPPEVFKDARDRISDFVEKALKLKSPNDGLSRIDFFTRLFLVIKSFYEKKFPAVIEKYCQEHNLQKSYLFAFLASYIQEEALSAGNLTQKEESLFYKGHWRQKKGKDGVMVWSCKASF